MIVNDKSLCVICNSKGYIEHQIKHTKKNMYVTPEQKYLLQTKLDFHNVTGFRTLVLSKQSIENLKHYRVPKTIRLDLLNSLPNRKDIIQVGENYCIKYVKTDDRLNVIYLNKGDMDGFNFGTFTFFFSVNLLNGNLISDGYDYNTKENIKSEQKVIDQYYTKFMIVITYLELTEVELKVIFSKSVSKEGFGPRGLKNNSKKSVIHVTSDWNIEKIIVGTFGVRGHMRCIKPDGVKHLKFRYVPVKPYTKNLIMRKSQKEKESQTP